MVRQELNIWQLIALSAPSIAFAAFEIAQRILLPSFLTDHVGIGVASAGVLLMSVRLLDIVADAVCGTLSDLDFFPHFGRRRFWIAAGLPLALASSTYLFLAAPGAVFLPLVLAYGLATLGWTMINASHGAWALEAATGLAPRSRVFAGRTIAGLLAFTLLTGALVLGPPDAGSRVHTSLIFLWIVTPLTTMLLFRFAPHIVQTVRSVRLADLVGAWRMSFASAPRRRLGFLFALVGSHAAIAAGSYVFLVERGLSLAGWAMQGLFIQALATGLGLVAATHLLHRIGARHLLVRVFAGNAMLAVVILALPAGNVSALLVWAAVRGLVSGVDFMVLRALAGEELDAEHARTGKVPAGVLYAAFHLPYNLGGAIATGLLFYAYALSGLSDTQPASEAARWLPALGGGGLSLLSLAVALGLERNPSSGAITERSSYRQTKF